jgi:release factor glutamine methyltransferase
VWVQWDLLSSLRPAPVFGMITANPPYVSPAAYLELSPEVRDYEPRIALYADDDGLALIRRLLDEARPRLRPGGVFLSEISSEQGRAAAAAAEQAGYVDTAVLRDYPGRERVLRCRRPDRATN